MAQIIVAVQMVLEEKFVYKHDVHPLRAVGTEGKAVLCLQLYMQHVFTLILTQGWTFIPSNHRHVNKIKRQKEKENQSS